jgi:hypothetical protein
MMRDGRNEPLHDVTRPPSAIGTLNLHSAPEPGSGSNDRRPSDRRPLIHRWPRPTGCGHRPNPSHHA